MLYMWPRSSRSQRRAAEGRARAAQGYALGGAVPDGIAASAQSPAMPVLLIARTVQGYGGGLRWRSRWGSSASSTRRPLRTRILAMVSGVWGWPRWWGRWSAASSAEFGWWRGAFWAEHAHHPSGSRRGLPDAAAAPRR